jgi:two-component system chemotaxis response regulator CheY
VLVAEDGARGLSLAQQQKADLVVTDLNMPVMDGIALITQLRALPQYRFTPILMLTTESQEDKKVAGRRAGATGWIIKPFDPARFIAVIQKVCPPA